MAKFEPFCFSSLEELRAKAAAVKADIRFQEDLSPLARRVPIAHTAAPNAIAVLPMEGCDSNPDGSPSELVERRYLRLYGGGAGLVWWEACAVVPEGRTNPRQMMLTEENLNSFSTLLKRAKNIAQTDNGYTPLAVLQLTHSGRYSRPEGDLPMPILPQHDPLLDPRVGAAADAPLVTDAYLDGLTDDYVKSALLAREAGFDGVDIKSCHRYLLSELLAAHTRPGPYGGSFENRTRFLLRTVKAVRAAVGPDFIVACRFNIYDAHPYPYGFGCVPADGAPVFDSTEPLELVRLLCDAGVDLLSNSAGNPYYLVPQVTRPFDRSSTGIPIPDEHPLESVARLFSFTRMVQKAAGRVPVVGNGYTWLRQFLPYAGAANLSDGGCAMMGLGRESFAYPDAPRELLTTGRLEPNKCCISCSKCTQIMRDHGRTGCVVRDAGVYAPLYREARADAEQHEGVFQ